MSKKMFAREKQHKYVLSVFIKVFLPLIVNNGSTDRTTIVSSEGALVDIRPSKPLTLEVKARVVCPNFGHPALTSSFAKYNFLQVKNSCAAIVNGHKFYVKHPDFCFKIHNSLNIWSEISFSSQIAIYKLSKTTSP